MKDVFATLKDMPKLKTFTKALTQAGLDKTLNRLKEVTVFAPNDNAFAQWPQAAQAEFMKDSARQKDLLGYHLVGEEIRYEGLAVPKIVSSLQGEKLSVNPQKTYTVNNVRVLQPDIVCTNGYIHIIYKVLDPYARV